MIEELMKILEGAKERIVSNIESEGAKASGRTGASFRVDYVDGKVRLVAGGERTAPIGTLEGGRPKGAVPQRFHEVIKEWLVVKGATIKQIPYLTDRAHKYSVQERSLIAASKNIAWSISQKGTLLHQNGGRSTIYSDVVRDIIPQIQEQVSIAVFKTIELN